ncbi:MAG: TonB-dependent receptor [Bacteroidales bacterium]|nr:TonB-dependent receptor [Bacteroidales bacterium]
MKQYLLSFYLIVIGTFLTGMMYGQSGIVQGTVTDPNGELLIGATIMVKGTTQGTITNSDGQYTLVSVAEGEVVLVASYIGYGSQEVTVQVVSGKTSTADFVLSEDITQLDELVVIGYGTKRKRDITSSISSVKAEDLANSTQSSFQNALQGKAAGVQITAANGMPGSAMTVRIRGTSSITSSSEPLYVVDGIPVITGNYADGWADGTNTLSALSPSDIESIEILKDASAAAIYGSRSANGVVLITTKSGKSGQTKFNAGYWVGVNKITNIPDMLNAEDYLKYGKIAWENSGNDISDDYQAFYDNLSHGITREIADTTNTDWIDEMSRTGKVQQFNLSASGGDVKNTFYIGGAYRDEEGVLIGNDYKKLSAKINYEHIANDVFSIGTKNTLVYEENRRVPTGWAGGLGTAQSRSLPIMPVYDSTGKFFAPRSGINPVAYDADMDYGMNVYTLISTIYAQLNFTKWLSFRSDVAANVYNHRESRYVGTITQEKATSMQRTVMLSNLSTNNYFSFDKSFQDMHHVYATLGMSVESRNQYENLFRSNDFPVPGLTNPTSGSVQSGAGYEAGHGFLSFFGRASYNYSNKYYATFSLRRDASSRFGANYQYGWFPSGSAGWTLSEESFLEGNSVMTYLKLRGSYGVTGNAEIGDFEYMGLWRAVNYLDSPGLEISKVENLDLRWERTAQLDVGIDFQLWNGRVSGGFDYYYKQTSDLILNRPINQTSGQSSMTANVGDLENKGIELFLTTHNLPASSRLQWETDLTFGRNANVVTNTDDNQLAGENYGNNVVAEGYPIGTWELVEWAGIAREDQTATVTDWIDFNDQDLGTTTKQVDILAGDEIFYNHWGEITNEFDFDRDAKFTGNPYPSFFGGLNNTLQWKGFDFGIFFTFSVGMQVYRDDGKFLDGGFDGNWNQTAIIKDSWSEDNPNGQSHKLYWQPENRNFNSTRYLDEASYLRLKNLTLGYTLPGSLTNRFFVERLRIYVGGTNIWTLTDYSGWDPEVNRDGSGNITQGVTYLSPPQVSTVNFGIELDF